MYNESTVNASGARPSDLHALRLIHMLEHSDTLARVRLLNLFDLLAQLIVAPAHLESHPPLLAIKDSANTLLNYLAKQASMSGAQAPDMLARQLQFMALSALEESLRDVSPDNKQAAFTHAKLAAAALIDTQINARRFKHRKITCGIAAGVFTVVGVGSILLDALGNPPRPITSALASTQATMEASKIVSPAQTALIYASIEAMRQGVCQFPQALMIPASEQTVYLQNVVAGSVPTNAEDQATATRLMQKVTCDYAPMLMKNSTS